MKKNDDKTSEIEERVVNNLTNDDSSELINLLRECKIRDGVIMLAIFGIGTHTEYYRALYNRVKNNKDKITEEYFKSLVLDILHEIDRNEDE